MSDCLTFKPSNCKNCYKCIRNCPVKSIRFSSGQANIIAGECILCGSCFVGCPQNAKVIRNDVSYAQYIISGSAPVYVSLAPSFVAKFNGMTITSMRNALMKLGFAGVEETAVGAKLVKDEYDRMLAEGNRDILISSCCHSVNLLIQKHFPEALPYLANVLSPMLAHGIDIKRRIPGAQVVFIGPCIAKKDEVERYDGVDCALTFEELSQWMELENVTPEYAPDEGDEGKTRIFPTTGGVIESMRADEPGYTYVAIDGVQNCINAIEDIIAGRLHKCFIEMSACAGSCVGGPVMGNSRRLPISDFVAVSHYSKPNDFTVPPLGDMQKDLPSLAKRRDAFSEYEISEVLRSIGKTSKANELNCGCCGYNTCRDKAVAVLQGKADIEMCMPYMKERAQSYSSNIINNTPNAVLILTELYEIQEANTVACRMFNKSMKEMVGQPVVTFIDPTPFFDVVIYEKEVRDRRVYLPDHKKWVDMTVTHDKGYHLILCVMHDVTLIAMHDAEREDMRRRTVEVTDRVIEKQMRAVQEIASLLGESTAETKVALTKLKESMKDE